MCVNVLLFPFIPYQIVSYFYPVVAVVLATEGKVNRGHCGLNQGVGLSLETETTRIFWIRLNIIHVVRIRLVLVARV